MELSTLWKEKTVTLSFEAFPPKKDSDFDSVRFAVEQIAELKPDFMSVTYGAGGGTSAYTAEIARIVQTGHGVPALAHLTCVSSNRDRIHQELEHLKAAGIENILALRGDYPEGYDPAAPRDYRYAADLVREIKAYGGFCIGAACYPEGHTECHSQEEDLLHLKEKVDCGVDFLTTQMFFDNSALYSFLFRAQRVGIDLPVLAGIMPVTNAAQITRILSLSGTTLPTRFRMILDKFRDRPDAMKQAGIVYAAEQIVDLVANGIRGIHVYTMNKPDVAARLRDNLSEVLGR
ncbi:methylenetetrahydrofolate reductase [Evtepia sp.]|uniref:methylenetetrahydrofolate reductase n=1 Tax=Evtepia sp. TaxID=2773933 RepID=UPI003F160EAF